jgi:lysine N6-hydroxylase
MSQPVSQPDSQPISPPRAAAEEPYDLLGIGIGPFNLSLAALADGERSLRTLFVERKPEFRWHPGLLVDGARMQVPFLADLVSLVDPTSPWSFLAYLRAHDRLFPFYFAERFHLSRREYDHYCRWVAERLPHCRFGTCVAAARWERAEDGEDLFAVDLRTAPADGSGALPRTTTVRARNLVLGVGTEPVLPEAFAALDGHPRVWHAGEYRHRRAALADARDVTVVGSGQSGAEVFLDLLRERERAAESGLPAGGRTVRWLTRSAAIAPMEYSKLGLEHFTPDYTRYFHALPAAVRDELIARQGQLYKAASADTLAEIHDLLYERSVGGGPHTTEDVVISPGTAVLRARSAPYGGPLELRCRHRESEGDYTLRTDAVILATGYAARRPALLDPLADLIDWDDQGRYQVDLDHRVALRPDIGGGLYVQNAELHTHGVGTPDLGLGAHRAAVILNSVAGRTVHRLPARTAFTTFGPAAAAPDGSAPSPDRCQGKPDAEEPTRAAAR